MKPKKKAKKKQPAAARQGASPPPPGAAAPIRDRWLVLGVCLFLVAITWAVFGQTAHFQFVSLDDDLYVYENSFVTSGLNLPGILAAFTRVMCNFYHPLTMISLMADDQLHGLNAGGYHITNVLIHTGSVILLFLVLRQMTGALWRSAFVAAVFAIHPLRAESVAWVSERKDVLSTFFFMLTLAAYMHYVRKPETLARYLMVPGLFLVNLLCKPAALTLPFLLLLLDYWPLHRIAKPATVSGLTIPRRLLLEKIPLLALALAASIVAYLAQGEAVEPIAAMPIPLRLSNAVISYVVYLRQMLWPEALAVLYPYPEKNYPIWELGMALFVLAVITAFALKNWRNRPWLAVGWFWYLGMLVPVIGIVTVNPSAHGDRYTYLPQIGACLMLVWTLAEITANSPGRRMIQCGFSAAILLALVWTARAQVAYWTNSLTLWQHTLSCTSGNAFAELNLGFALFQDNEVDKSMEHFNRALAINPNYAEAHYDLGIALMKKGKPDDAIEQYRKTLELKSNHASARNNLGIALASKGDLEDAITQYRKALEIKPDYADAHFNLGLALTKSGQLQDAIDEYHKAIELNPRSPEALSNLGNALFKQGKFQDAITQYNNALDLNPNYAEARNNLGVALCATGHTDQGIEQYHKALLISPDYSEARSNLGKALLLNADFNGAMDAFSKIISLPAGPVEKWSRLGNNFMQQRNFSCAIASYQHADKLGDGTNPLVLQSLAAAYAQAGRFADAIPAAQHALDLASRQKNDALAAALQQDLLLYKSGRAKP